MRVDRREQATVSLQIYSPIPFARHTAPTLLESEVYDRVPSYWTEGSACELDKICGGSGNSYAGLRQLGIVTNATTAIAM